jgi:hypothetical protein
VLKSIPLPQRGVYGRTYQGIVGTTLCESSGREKLMELVKEINRLLEEKEQRLRALRGA